MNLLVRPMLVALVVMFHLCCGSTDSITEVSITTPLVTSSIADTLHFTSGIRAIHHDSEGNYWFGSHREGVARFDGQSYRYFTTEEGLANNQVRSIKEDDEGRIWLGTANGVSVYNGERIATYPTRPNSLLSHYGAASSVLYFTAGTNPGINWFDGVNLNYLPFPPPSNFRHDNSYAVTAISVAPNDDIWIGTYPALFHLDGKTINAFDEDTLPVPEGDNLHIRSVLADSKGRVWIGNNGIGVHLLEGDSAINFSDAHGLLPKRSNDLTFAPLADSLAHVFAIEEDAQGNIWFGDRDTGAWKYDGGTMTNYTVDDKLSSPMVWTIYTDRNDNLLIGMAAGGVYQFDGKGFERVF